VDDNGISLAQFPQAVAGCPGDPHSDHLLCNL
jgi:hypothetical protein